MNWKVDALSNRTIGIFYLLLFIIIPQFVVGGYVGIWIMLTWCIVIPRVLYLIGILDYFSKKLEK
jgi:hypothetical protein